MTDDFGRCPHIVKDLVPVVLVRGEAGLVAIDEAPSEEPVQEHGDHRDDEDRSVARAGIA